MTLKNTADRWGTVSQTFHWLIVLLILGIAIVGLTMVELPKTPKYFWVYTAHKSHRLTVLVLAVLRLGWRLYAGKPLPVPGTPRWQKQIAEVTHWMLYALIFAMPLSGWLYDSGSGLRPFHWFGLVGMPKLARRTNRSPTCRMMCTNGVSGHPGAGRPRMPPPRSTITCSSTTPP